MTPRTFQIFKKLKKENMSLQAALHLEKQILELSRNKNQNIFTSWNGVAHNLSRKLRELLFDEILKRSPREDRDSREMERRLWKTCFYIFIDLFRKDLFSSCSNSNEKIQEKDLKIRIDSFRAFLSEAEAFYRKLGEQKISVHSKYRCLVFLGDIARYKELHSYDRKNNRMTKTRFKEAESYYGRALRLDVSFGSAHNQLAVLATYRDANVVATYHYIRALYVMFDFTVFECQYKKTIETREYPTTDTVAHHLRQLYQIYEPCFRES